MRAGDNFFPQKVGPNGVVHQHLLVLLPWDLTAISQLCRWLKIMTLCRRETDFVFFSVEGLGLIKLYFPCVSEIKVRKCRYDEVLNVINLLSPSVVWDPSHGFQPLALLMMAWLCDSWQLPLEDLSNSPSFYPLNDNSASQCWQWILLSDISPSPAVGSHWSK